MQRNRNRNLDLILDNIELFALLIISLITGLFAGMALGKRR